MQCTRKDPERRPDPKILDTLKEVERDLPGTSVVYLRLANTLSSVTDHAKFVLKQIEKFPEKHPQ